MKDFLLENLSQENTPSSQSQISDVENSQAALLTPQQRQEKPQDFTQPLHGNSNDASGMAAPAPQYQEWSENVAPQMGFWQYQGIKWQDAETTSFLHYANMANHLAIYKAFDDSPELTPEQVNGLQEDRPGFTLPKNVHATTAQYLAQNYDDQRTRQLLLERMKPSAIGKIVGYGTSFLGSALTSPVKDVTALAAADLVDSPYKTTEILGLESTAMRSAFLRLAGKGVLGGTGFEVPGQVAQFAATKEEGKPFSFVKSGLDIGESAAIAGVAELVSPFVAKAIKPVWEKVASIFDNHNPIEPQDSSDMTATAANTMIDGMDPNTDISEENALSKSAKTLKGKLANENISAEDANDALSHIKENIENQKNSLDERMKPMDDFFNKQNVDPEQYFYYKYKDENINELLSDSQKQAYEKMNSKLLDFGKFTDEPNFKESMDYFVKNSNEQLRTIKFLKNAADKLNLSESESEEVQELFSKRRPTKSEIRMQGKFSKNLVDSGRIESSKEAKNLLKEYAEKSISNKELEEKIKNQKDMLNDLNINPDEFLKNENKLRARTLEDEERLSHKSAKKLLKSAGFKNLSTPLRRENALEQYSELMQNRRALDSADKTADIYHHLINNQPEEVTTSQVQKYADDLTNPTKKFKNSGGPVNLDVVGPDVKEDNEAEYLNDRYSDEQKKSLLDNAKLSEEEEKEYKEIKSLPKKRNAILKALESTINCIIGE